MVTCRTRDEAALILAASHKEIEPGIEAIYRVRTAHENDEDYREPVKLLEVTTYTFPAGIQPVIFRACGGIPYPSMVVEVTPDEYEQIGRGELPLPDEWTLDSEPIGIGAPVGSDSGE